MDFNFSETAGATQSTTSRLPGNEIHTVTFKGCELRDIKGVKDASQTYKVLDIKFANKQGYFNDTVWEPKQSDLERGSFTSNKGDVIPQASNFENMMLKFKHLIDAVNPELAAKIDSGEKEVKAGNWDGLRQLMVEATKSGIDTELQIKLSQNNKGEARFPFFSRINEDKKPIINNNFMGPKLSFSSYELDRINKAKAAKPASASTFSASDAPTTSSLDDSKEIDFEL